MRGFRNFLTWGNLVDLAVAVVIGVAPLGQPSRDPAAAAGVRGNRLIASGA